jgi:hypothetical protein
MGGEGALLLAAFADMDGVSALPSALPRCASNYSIEDCCVLDSLDAFGEEQGELELLGADEEAQPGWAVSYEYGSVASPTASPRQQNSDAVTLCFPKDKKAVKRKRSLSNALSFSELQSKQQDGTSKAKKIRSEPRDVVVPASEVPSSLVEHLRRNESDSQRQLTSSFRGVCWYKRTQRWVVQIKIRGVRVHIGYYKDEVEAATAYERAIKKVAVNPNIDRAELRE